MRKSVLALAICLLGAGCASQQLSTEIAVNEANRLCAEHGKHFVTTSITPRPTENPMLLSTVDVRGVCEDVKVAP